MAGCLGSPWPSAITPECFSPRMPRNRRVPPNKAGSGGLRHLIVASRLRQALDELGDMRLFDYQRRKNPHHIVAGGDSEQAMLAQIIHEGPAVGLHFHAQHEADSAHAFEEVV